MKLIAEYLSTKIKSSKIIATDKNIQDIVKGELDRLGLDADLNHIDVSKVTNMREVFSCHDMRAANSIMFRTILSPKYNKLNPDISKWDVSNVNNMERMFEYSQYFNCDISGWDTHSVTNMEYMFNNCTNFNQDISSWNVSNVESFWGMFSNAVSFLQDLSNWKTQHGCVNALMFSGATLMKKHRKYYPIFID